MKFIGLFFAKIFWFDYGQYFLTDGQFGGVVKNMGIVNVFLKTFVLSIVNIAFAVFAFLKESFVKVLTKQKMIWKVKILCNKAPNRSQF